MHTRVPSITACTLLSLVNFVGFFLFAHFAEPLGFVGSSGVVSFSLTIGLLTMLVTSALLVWSAVDHFLIEPTANSMFSVALNLGFLCAFVAI